jgi:hypothetical protein
MTEDMILQLLQRKRSVNPLLQERSLRRGSDAFSQTINGKSRSRSTIINERFKMSEADAPQITPILRSMSEKRDESAIRIDIVTNEGGAKMSYTTKKPINTRVCPEKSQSLSDDSEIRMDTSDNDIETGIDQIMSTLTSDATIIRSQIRTHIHPLKLLFENKTIESAYKQAFTVDITSLNRAQHLSATIGCWTILTINHLYEYLSETNNQAYLYLIPLAIIQTGNFFIFDLKERKLGSIQPNHYRAKTLLENSKKALLFSFWWVTEGYAGYIYCTLTFTGFLVIILMTAAYAKVPDAVGSLSYLAVIFGSFYNFANHSFMVKSTIMHVIGVVIVILMWGRITIIEGNIMFVTMNMALISDYFRVFSSKVGFLLGLILNKIQERQKLGK